MAAAAIYLDASVTRQFEGKKWAIPAKVYARPVELYEGKLIAPDELQAQLKRQGYQAVRTVSRPGTFSRTGNQFVIYSRGFHFPDGSEQPRYAEVSFNGSEVSSLRGRQDHNLPLLRLDPQPIGGIYPASYEDRLLIRISQAPKFLIPGLLAIEDRDFYSHYGVSISSIARAMVVNLKAGGVVQGGSTITQQLVKNFFLSNERTVVRKAKEALMALLLEFHYTKDEILETYLNEVYLGQQGRRAIHGFGMASQFYFAQPLQELNLARTALLIAMVKGPSYYDPRRYSKRALERRNLVLDVLADQGLVPRSEVERSKKLPLGVVSREQVKTNAFPAYIDFVKRQLRNDYKETDLTSEGLRVFTNLDPIIQRKAQSSVSNTLKNLDSSDELQGAMVVTSAQTGDLLALVGDRNPGYAGFNRAIEAYRPVGSLLKPAIYLTALEQPRKYSLTTLVNDTSVKIKDGKGGFWQPQNYDKKSNGQVPLYLALAKSYNQAAANTGMALGLRNVLNTIERLGITEELPPYPSVLLGSVSLAPIEIANIYQTIASGGFRMPIRAIDAVVDNQGNALKRYNLSVERVVEPEPMELLRTAMSIGMKEGTGRRAYQSIHPSTRLGGKTGTTNDQRDSWFAGYSGNLMSVVWLGKDDNAPTKLTGSSGALKVWSRFMSSVPLQSVQPLRGTELEMTWVNPASNSRSHKYCEGARRLPYIKESIPTVYGGCKPTEGTNMIDKIKAWFQ
ncbi:penicillin-binding protein 1B [Endozoicomonas sp. (ex Bugula neritina AB1)]|nr:penicillin-binding protein 1B [Endozoicomonas sp. (ex Bugula neritina AB1)]